MMLQVLRLVFIHVVSLPKAPSESTAVSSFGELIWEARVSRHYLEFQPVSLLDCAGECYTRKRCTTFSFCRTMSYCELSLETEDVTTMLKSENADGFITSYVKTWPKDLFGKCGNHNCSENERCDINSARCELSDCGPAPPAACQSVLLVHGDHQINNSVIFRCDKDSIVIPERHVGKDNECSVTCNKEGQWENISYSCLAPPLSRAQRPVDCQEIVDEHFTHSNTITFMIYPASIAKKVQCEKSGKWTVIQNRCDGSENFLRKWHDYKCGFGDAAKEYWIGNDVLYHMTSNGNYQLKIELEDFEGNNRFATYQHFSVGDEGSKYKLSVYGYHGNAGDSMAPHNGRQFSTIDSDDNECAVRFSGAWWYNHCHRSNLNGLYLHGIHKSYANGINWRTWRGYHYSYKRCKMMIRRN